MKLGEQKNFPHDAGGLETFENPLKYGALVELVTHEFTCLCPKTGQPDFAKISIRYVPREKCVESKSLKLYFWHYRDRGAFHEAVTQKIFQDLHALLSPRWMQVLGEFGVRGGIYERVLVTSAVEDVDDEALHKMHAFQP